MQGFGHVHETRRQGKSSGNGKNWRAVGSCATAIPRPERWVSTRPRRAARADARGIRMLQYFSRKGCLPGDGIAAGGACRICLSHFR